MSTSKGAPGRLCESAARVVEAARERARSIQLDEAGFGLLEVVVAITILLVVLLPASYLIDTAVKQTASAKDKVAAAELAEQGLEQLGQDSLTTLEPWLDVNHRMNTYTVAGVSYTVTSYLTWQGAGNVPDLCTSGSPPQEISASVIVTWGPGKQKLAEQSVIAPAYGLPVFYITTAITSGQTITSLTSSTAQTIAGGAALVLGADTPKSQTIYVTSAGVTNSTVIPITSVAAQNSYPANTTAVALPDEGYLAVQVNGASGTVPGNISSVTVSITSTTSGSTTSTYSPDSNGCVYQQELAGNYTVTLGSTSTPPFVNVSDNAATDTAPSYTVAVTAEQTTQEPVTFDQAGAVTFGPTGSVPIAGNLPVSVANSGITPGGNGGGWQNIISSANASSTSSVNLYPFTSNYAVWYGDCKGEEPQSPSTVSVPEGGSTSATISGLSTLTVGAQNTASTPAAWSGATVTATIADPNSSTDGCGNDALTMAATATNGESQAQVIEYTRNDTSVSWSTSSAVISDTAITTGDQGKQVLGITTATGNPVYVGSVGTSSFTLYSTPIASGQTATTAVKPSVASTTGSSFYVVSETYSITITTPAPDNKTNSPAATINVMPAGIVCTAGCTTATTNVLYGTGGSAGWPIVAIS